MNNINYGNAKYSIAMIEFRDYIETLLTVDKKYEQANFVFNYVMQVSEKSEDMYNMLRLYSFVEFAKVQKYLKEVRKNIIKHQTELKEFLSENESRKNDFNAQLDILIPLLEQYEKDINAKIQKCFDYLKEESQDLIV